jgi:hypothetical protein
MHITEKYSTMTAGNIITPGLSMNKYLFIFYMVAFLIISGARRYENS